MPLIFHYAQRALRHADAADAAIIRCLAAHVTAAFFFFR